jgi:hypothetical protein
MSLRTSFTLNKKKNLQSNSLIRLFELIMYIGVIFLSNLILNLNQTELMLIRWCFSINSTWFPLTLGHPHFLLSTQHLSSFLFSISPSAAYAICLYFCFMLIKWLSSIQKTKKEKKEINNSCSLIWKKIIKFENSF